VPEASTKMEHLLENFLQLKINFEVKEAHDKFVKIRLMNSDDQFSVLQANKQLRDQLWKKDLDKATKFDYNGVFFSDDVSKTCREIRATLNQKKKEMKDKGFVAWILPTLCYIDQDGVKQKKSGITSHQSNKLCYFSYLFFFCHF